MTTRTRLRQAVAVLATTASVLTFVVATAAPAPAAGPVPVECDTGGSLSVAPDATGAAIWTLHLEGTCLGTLQGTEIVTVDGTGTSAGAGLCDGSVLVRDLTIEATVTERNVVSGQTVTTHQIWSLPVTTYPAATPVLIGGEASGLGALTSRIFLRCGAAGSENTIAVFSFRS